MRKRDLKPGCYYWIREGKKLKVGEVIDRAEFTYRADPLRVVFCGESALYFIGQPDVSNPWRIDPRRFIAEVSYV